MAKLTKESFQYFKGIYELPCGWVVEDDYYEDVIQPQLDLMKNAKYRAEFMFKCLYPNEKPLSKEDYKRTRYTHRKICDKRSTLMQVRTKSEDESFQRMGRKLKIVKGIYPTGMSFEETRRAVSLPSALFLSITCNPLSFFIHIIKIFIYYDLLI